MEKNIKLFPYYKMFSYDVLFFYAVSTLYLIQIKGFTIAQIGLISSFYYLFCAITQVPASVICDKLGLKKAILMGNILLITYFIGLIVFPNYYFLIACEFLDALGFALKGCSEPPFLYSSLKKIGRENEQSNVEGRGDFLYFILEGFACVLSGYLFSINSYLPIVMSITCLVISTFICYLFKPIPRNKSIASAEEYIKELKLGFKFIFKSTRLRALLIFSFSFVGIVYTAVFLHKAYLNELKASSQIFGYIYAGMAISSALGAIFQKKIENKLRNKTLSITALIFIITIIFTGIFLFMPLPQNTLIILGSIFFLTQAFLKGNFWITITVYLSRYTTNSIRPKILSIYNLVRDSGAFILLSTITLFVNNISLPLCFVLVGVVFFIIIILIASYMDSRVGLNPSTYSCKDRFDLLVEEDSKNKS